MLRSAVSVEPETEVLYWKGRVAALEMLVCDLLTKNQAMRSEMDRECPASAAPGGAAEAPADEAAAYSLTSSTHRKPRAPERS